jgi:hypothetical protein
MSLTCSKISEGPTIMCLTMTNSDMMYNFIYSLKENRTNIFIILNPMCGVKIFGILLASNSVTLLVCCTITYQSQTSARRAILRCR